MVYTERNCFRYTGDLRVIQANFRPIVGPEGSRSDGVYGKDMKLLKKALPCDSLILGF